MNIDNTYDVGIYLRLSKDDNNGHLESMSISNQRQLLKDYVLENLSLRAAAPREGTAL